VPDSLDIDALKAAIESRYRVGTRHAGAIDVHGIFPGLPWPEIVSVFDLVGHSRARMAYAWRYGKEPNQVAVVLGEPPIATAVDSVKAWLAAGPDGDGSG
jgi:hypothetical protein